MTAITSAKPRNLGMFRDRGFIAGEFGPADTSAVGVVQSKAGEGLILLLLRAAGQEFGIYYAVPPHDARTLADAMSDAAEDIEKRAAK